MFFLKILSFLPFRALYVLSDFLCFLAYVVFGYRKKVVFENLENSFPEKSAQECSLIARGFYQNLCDVLVETLKASSMKQSTLAERVTFDGIEEVRELMKSGSSMIGLASHQCNWEWLLMAGNIHLGYPVYAVYRPLHNAYWEVVMLKIRSRFGAKMVPMKDFWREIVRTKDTVKGLAMLADQTPPWGEIQHWTMFMNQETPFFVGSDKIARKMNYPVYFLDMKRIRRGRYKVILRLLTDDAASLREFEVIDLYAKAVEKSIRESPSDWLWSHRRWKHKKEPLS